MLLLNSCTHIWVLVWFLWVYAQNEGFWVFLYSPFSRDHQTVVCAALLYFIFSLAMLCVLQIIHILIKAYFPLLKKITVVILVSVGVKYYPIFSSVQSLSHVQLFATPWTRARLASLSIANFRSSLKLTSNESVMPYNRLILCRPLLLLPLILPSIRVFSNESVLCIMWPKYWSFGFNISPSNAYSGLISFMRTGWISLQSKRLSRVFSNTTVQKHKFFSAQLSL